MGINFYIGEPVIDFRYNELDIVIKEVVSPDAPTFENGTYQGNRIEFSYSSYSEFIEITSTEGLFNELVLEHPAVIKLKEEHHHIISNAIEIMKLKYPHIIPRFKTHKAMWGEETSAVTVEDAYLAKLIMFQFWIRWALDNCEHPAIMNS